MARKEPPGLTFNRPRRHLAENDGGPALRPRSSSARALAVVAGLFGLFLLILLGTFFVLQLS